jgi:hypothetical protein
VTTVTAAPIVARVEEEREDRGMHLEFTVECAKRVDGWWIVAQIGSRREEHGPYRDEGTAAEEQLELIEEFQLRTADGDPVQLLPIWLVLHGRPLNARTLVDVLADNGLDVAVATLPRVPDQGATFLILAVHPAQQDPDDTTKLVLRSMQHAGRRAIVASLDRLVVAAVLDDAEMTWASTTVGAASVDAFRASNGHDGQRRPWRAARSPAGANGPPVTTIGAKPLAFGELIA